LPKIGKMNPTGGTGRGRLAKLLISEVTNLPSVIQIPDELDTSEQLPLLQFDDIQNEPVPTLSLSTFEEPILSSQYIQLDELGSEASLSSIQELAPPSEVQPIEVVTNFIRLKREQNYDVFLYVVEFQPPLDNRKVMCQILESEHLQKRLKVKPFAIGSKFYLPFEVPNFNMYPIPHPEMNDISIRVIVSLIKRVPLREQVVLFNCIFKKIMTELNYCFMKTKYFDPKQAINLEEWMMEIWPGYALDVVQVGSNDLMLLCDISHRVLHKTNVLDHLKLLMPNQRYKQVACRHLLGTSVITTYNRQTYRIDDIDFEANPLSTFKWGSEVVTYMDYFKQHWGLDVKHIDQPLLVHRKYMPKSNSV